MLKTTTILISLMSNSHIYSLHRYIAAFTHIYKKFQLSAQTFSVIPCSFSNNVDFCHYSLLLKSGDTFSMSTLSKSIQAHLSTDVYICTQVYVHKKFPFVSPTAVTATVAAAAVKSSVAPLLAVSSLINH